MYQLESNIQDAVETGSKNNFSIVTDTDVVPTPKSHYQPSRIHVPSSDSGQHRFLPNFKMADKNRK